MRAGLRHGAVWARVLIDDLKQQGYSVGQIVGNTGFELAALDREGAKISFEQIAALFERAAELTGNDLLGFERGKTREIRRIGVVAYVGLSSPTVATFLHNLARFSRVFSEAVEINTARLDQEGVLEWHFNVPQSASRRQFVEFSASGTLHELRTITNRDIRPRLVEFRHLRKSGKREIARYVGSAVKYGADENRIHLRLRDLELPLRTADDYLYQALCSVCEEALAQQKASKPPLIIAVEREIARGCYKQDEVALALAMSTRTLSRRLADEGVTFFGVLEGFREAMAKGLIGDTDMQLTEIAFLTGYKDLSTFSAAFRRWTGLTPTEFRKLLLDKAR